MISVIHGDDLTASRKLFTEKRKDTKEPILDGQVITTMDIKQRLSSGGLFNEIEPIFIENLLLSKTSKRLDEILTFLKNLKEADVYLWEGKELGKKLISPLGTPIIETFKIPQNTFGFLDGIKPNNGKRNVELFHQALDGSNEDLLFFMIIRQFRLLLGVVSNSEIDEVKRLAPWQKNKLLSQAKLYSKDMLLSFYSKLSEIDLGQKTGALTMPLRETIDFLLLDL